MRTDITITNEKHRPYYVMHGYAWMPEGNTNAVIHVVHGITEHIGRYEEFAQNMNERGVAVVGYDLRGHGQNENDYQAATFVSGKTETDFGWGAAIEDLELQVHQISNMFPEAEYCMMGVSLGALLVRDLMPKLPAAVQKIILVNPEYNQGLMGRLKINIFNSDVKQTPAGSSSVFSNRFTFEFYNTGVSDAKTPWDWMCSDVQQLAKYQADMLVNKKIASDLVHDMLYAMQRVNNAATYKMARQNVPVLLIGGTNDPVSQAGKGAAQCQKVLNKAGYFTKNIMIPGRHDLFHEFSEGSATALYDEIAHWV